MTVSTVSVAVLGWGSLVWRPTDRQVTIRLQTPGLWGCDGPVLPVEFARISRDESLTLVIVSEHHHSVPTLWSVSAFDEPEAIQNLAGRENITKNLDAIHGVRQDGSRIGAANERIASEIHTWLATRPSLSAVVWTGLGATPERWSDREYEDGFTIDNALSYLQSLKGSVAERAFEYIRNTPTQIDTLVRQRAKSAGLPV